MSCVARVGSASATGSALHLDVGTLSESAAAVLFRLSRLLFPHEAIDDGPYIAVVSAMDAMADTRAQLLDLLDGGVQRLESAQPEPWLALDETHQLETLQQIESTPFFQTVLATARVLFYNNKAIWPHFGYEGSSFEHGGYLNRGFNDLDWLPEPED